MELRIGIIPLPVVLVVLGATAYFLHAGRVPNEVCVMMPIIATGGFLCARWAGGFRSCGTSAAGDLRHVPALGAAVLPRPARDADGSHHRLHEVHGLPLSLHHGDHRGQHPRHGSRVLISGFAKIFVPLLVGSVLALLVGLLVGTAVGLGVRHTLLFVIIPIMAGGVAKAPSPSRPVTPASCTRPRATCSPGAAAGHAGQPDRRARRRPAQPPGEKISPPHRRGPAAAGRAGPARSAAGGDQSPPDVEQIAAAGLFAISLYLIGLLVKEAWDFPAPVVMLFPGGGRQAHQRGAAEAAGGNVCGL